jgi:hypothetical protein
MEGGLYTILMGCEEGRISIVVGRPADVGMEG